MAINRYHDFVLVAEAAENSDNKFAVSVFDSPVGQGEKKEIVALPDDLSSKVRRLEENKLDKDVSRQIELGEILAGLLLPAYARQLFSASLSRLRDGEGLRLRLRLADKLADMPWEYIYVQDTSRGERTVSGFLALDPRVSIVRHEAIAVPGDWFEAPGKRRVVVAMATPEHERYPKLIHLPTEQSLLKEALNGVAGLDTVYLPDYQNNKASAVTGATLKDLMAALMTHADVFHFSGHGEFVDETGKIVLADVNNQAVLFPADRLAELLKGKGIRLVVLGACETGRRDGRNVWSSVVASLLKAGIPAVVAMQFKIVDNLAAAFSGALYRALVAGFTVDEAVAMGRAAIRVEALQGQPDIPDWGVPVLYLRVPSGIIFNPVSDETARQEAEKKLGHLIDQHVREVSTNGRVIGAVIGSMQAETVEVKQKVDERVDGVMLGAYTFNIQGGQLMVRQEADVVSGTMIGAVISRLGGSPATQDEEQQALAKLEELLGVQKPPSARSKFCSNCGKPILEGAKFCANCGKPQPN